MHRSRIPQPAVPGAANAKLKIVAYTPAGPDIQFDSGTNPVQASAAATTPVTLSSLGASAAGLELTSNVPIVAGVLVPGAGIGSFTAGAAPVTDQGTAVYAWEADAAWYDPGTRRANFVVAMENPDGPLGGIAVSAGQEFFGRPAHTYRVDGYVIMVYQYNLLTRLADGSEQLRSSR